MKTAKCIITGENKNNCFVINGFGVEDTENETNAFYSKRDETIPNNPTEFIESLKERSLKELGCVITKFKIIEHNAETGLYSTIKEWNEPLPTLN